MLTHRLGSALRLALPVAAAAVMLAGCQSKDVDPLSFEGIAADLTPDLRGTRERVVDAERNMAYARDAQYRMLSDDIGRVFYTDHPSRLSPFPIIHSSGMPK